MAEKAVSYPLLGMTARWTASVRAMESARESPLFRDPWAEALAGPDGAEWLAQRTPERVLPIVLRTRYFDDFLVRITAQEGVRQIVLVAAGLDTRAFRLRWPEGTKIFELDQLAVLEHKKQILGATGAEPACLRHTVPVDLTGAWQEALVAASFDPHRPAGWLLEGFLFYLPNATGIDLLDAISRLAAPGSWMGFDTINSDVLTSPWTRSWIEMQAQEGAPWIGTMDDPEGFLEKRGWQVSLTQAGAEDANYGRWTLPVIPTKMPDMPHNWLVVAQKNRD